MPDTDTDIDDWTAFQALLDPDRKQLLDDLLTDLDRYSEPLNGLSEPHQTDGALLALVVQLKQEIEDLRNQLELQAIRDGAPATGPAPQRPASQRQHRTRQPQHRPSAVP